METKRHPKIWRKGKGDQPKPASQRQGDVLQQWMHPQRQLNAGHRQWVNEAMSGASEPEDSE